MIRRVARAARPRTGSPPPSKRSRMLLITLVLMALCSTPAMAQGEMHGNNEMHQYKKAKPAPLNEDLPYLKCPVCQAVAAESLRQVQALASQEKPARPTKRRFETSSSAGSLEEATEDLLQSMCDPENDGSKSFGQPAKSDAGKWISEFDVAKSGAALVLQRQSAGHCRRECRTIAKACESVLMALTEGDEDLAAYLVKAAKEKLSAGTVSQRMCTKMAGVCKKKRVPLWPEGKPRMNEEFKPKDAEDLKLEQMVATMPGGVHATTRCFLA